MNRSQTATHRNAVDALSIPEVTLPEFVLGEAPRRGDKRALIEAETGRELSYAQLADSVQRWHTCLRGRRTGSGEVIAVCAPNTLDFIVAMYGAMSTGAAVTPLNPMATVGEIERHLSRSGARGVITTASLYAEKVHTAARSANVPQTYVIDDAAASTETLVTSSHPAPRIQAIPSDVALIPFSGGTTGLPKGVMLSHRSLVTSLCQYMSTSPRTEDDVSIVGLPLFHILALHGTVNASLRAGGSVVILRYYDVTPYVRAIENYRVTRAEVAPAIVQDLATSPVVDEHDVSSLRVMMSAGAPLGTEVATACARRLGCRVKQGYGMTEFAGATHVAPDDGPDRPDSVGPMLAGVECRVVDPTTGADLGVDAPGELLVRAPGVMVGYLNDPEATAALIDADGWVHTGDIVTFDRDGWFRIADRIKELIKVSGAQVVPAELEDILLAHPGVSDAAVVPTPDERNGEAPKAYVVANSTVPGGELMAGSPSASRLTCGSVRASSSIGSHGLRRARSNDASSSSERRLTHSSALFRLEHEHRDLAVRCSALVLRPARIDPQAFGPDLPAPVAVDLHGTEPTRSAVDRERARGVGAEVEVPARVPALPEVRGDHGQPVGGRKTEHRNRARLPAASPGRGDHHHGYPRQQAGECVAPAGDPVDRAVDPVQHAGKDPRTWPTGRHPTHRALNRVRVFERERIDRGLCHRTIIPSRARPEDRTRPLAPNCSNSRGAG